MSVEGVLLTGGMSRRMGRDKATVLVDGVPMADRIASVFLDSSLKLTVLGPVAIPGAARVRDKKSFAGPLTALAGFSPTCDAAVVTACDLPLFDAALLALLCERLGETDALIPVVEGHPQPLCAIYAKRCFQRINDILTKGQRSMMAWLDVLDWATLSEEELTAADIRKEAALGVNTPDELQNRLRLPAIQTGLWQTRPQRSGTSQRNRPHGG